MGDASTPASQPPLTVTHADRVVFPEVGTTKGEVVAYYEAIAVRALPHLEGRPLSIKRFPKGLSSPGFFQKNVPPNYPASIDRFVIPRTAAGVTIYPVVSTPQHLAYLANQGAIELHVPLGRVPEPQLPDRIVIDLDPPSGAVDLIRRSAFLVRDFLGELGLTTVPIATGSKGYHVAGKIAEATTDLSTLLQKVAALLAAKHPEEMTTAFRIAQRKGRVFVDWLRNRPNATVVAPFSLRARPRAPVAVPLDWSELDATAPDAFTIADRERLLERPDPLAVLAPEAAASFVRNVDAAFERAGLTIEPFDRFRS